MNTEYLLQKGQVTIAVTCSDEGHNPIDVYARPVEPSHAKLVIMSPVEQGMATEIPTVCDIFGVEADEGLVIVDSGAAERV